MSQEFLVTEGQLARLEAIIEEQARRLAQAESAPPEERIAEVLHSIGFGDERHKIAREMLKLAQNFLAGDQQ